MAISQGHGWPQRSEVLSAVPSFMCGDISGQELRQKGHQPPSQEQGTEETGSHSLIQMGINLWTQKGENCERILPRLDSDTSLLVSGPPGNEGPSQAPG